jgi:tetraacyldisaccharide 4'-kinase
MKRFLYRVATDQIQGKGIAFLKIILWLLSLAYHFFVTAWALFYNIGIFKKYRLPCRVISIGNLTVGGVGKTPLVELVAQVLQRKNVQAVILTRGYKGHRTVEGGRINDEAMMLKGKLPGAPVLVGSDRVKNAQNYLKHSKADVFLLDDGFQHLRLSRDLDITAIDATNPWGNGFLLPRGILRESKSALKRAQIIVLTKTDLGQKHLQRIKGDLRSICPATLILESIHRPVSFVDARSAEAVGLELVRASTICAVSSIGDPDAFAQTLGKLGADIKKHFSFMDHHTYAPKDVEAIVQACLSLGIMDIITTEKDYVKLKYFLNKIPERIRVLFLKIEIVITDGKEKFLEGIDHIL